MSKFFICIYTFFETRRKILYLFLVSIFLLFLFFASKVTFEEDVTRFFPDTKDTEQAVAVFQNLKVKDKIIVMFSSADTTVVSDPDVLITAATQFENDLQKRIGATHINSIFFRVDNDLITGVTDLIYNNLPIFLTEADYARMDTLLTTGAIDTRMQTNYRNLLSPAGGALKSILKKDPVGFGITALTNLRDFELTANYTIYNGHIFSEDKKTLLMMISPRYTTGSTGQNDVLITTIETLMEEQEVTHPEIDASYFGGPSVAVYNARQIKQDTMITLNVAILIILIFILVVFKKKAAILWIIFPVIFGGVFALGLIFFIKGSISAIAIGAGAAVFGIAMSYSIHVLSHLNHVSSARQLIDELAYPLTVGSFTTVGAFLGLLFTSSDLLRDFGLFSALSLIGTTFFCLIFLPHFLTVKKTDEITSGRVLHFIERINNYAFDKNKILVVVILVITVLCLFASQKVTFDNDMMNLNYEPEHLKQAEGRLSSLFRSDKQTVLLVTTGKTSAESLRNYAHTNRLLDSLVAVGNINEYASVERILISPEVQQKRIDRWNAYWTPDKKQFLEESIRQSAANYHFKENSFNEFFTLLNKEYHVLNFTGDNSFSSRLLDEWTASTDSLMMVITQIRLDNNAKPIVYERLSGCDNLVIFDRSYFANKWVTTINADFYLILYISSFLIFFALLISYGRIELTLITFAPMAISWIIILGMMAMFGIQFNIVNIILSTFIFGIGDDFSIFIMDGLQNEYRTGKRMLPAHKTAIFCSSFTTVVGMGALIFARHPALQSIAFISLLGMITVVLVSYTIQPLLFRLFIAGPAAKGYFPYTLKSIGITFYAFVFFTSGCGILSGIVPVLILLPVSARRKKEWFNSMVRVTLRLFLKTIVTVKQINMNPSGEKFDKPAVIIANHQSFVDILVLLALLPRVVMVTNRWVWKSPFFGRIVRFSDFMSVEEGYDIMVQRLQPKVANGYSVVVFPEGTRSSDCTVKRFHKGAFFLAEALKLDIVPVLLYGNGMVVSKKQPFYVKTGIIASRILPRIAVDDTLYGVTYQERTKKIAIYFKAAYDTLCSELSTPQNPYFYHKLITNYIYKGPVEEWYMRIKVKIEKNYAFFNELIPRTASVTDIGCGYGPLLYMLSMLCSGRKLLGIDYDEDKIAVANHNFSKTDALHFVCANALEYDLPQSDVFILNDMLHYINYASQDELLQKCAARLHAGGLIIVRDGDSTNARNHRLTRLSEIFSTRILHFNKTENKLFFSSRQRMTQIAALNNLEIQVIDNARYTSNTIYLFRHKITL